MTEEWNFFHENGEFQRGTSSHYTKLNKKLFYDFSLVPYVRRLEAFRVTQVDKALNFLPKTLVYRLEKHTRSQRSYLQFIQKESTKL